MKIVIKIISKFPNLKVIENYNSGLGTIFMLHRVKEINSNGLKNVENLKITPKYLETIIKELKKMNYDFISLSELKERVLSKNKKFVVFTLDDGYKDNYEIAYKIFKKYNIPFTIYVTSSFPNRTSLLWWYSISDLILNNEKIITKTEVRNCRTKEEKEKTFLKLKQKILSFGNDNLESKIRNHLKGYDLLFLEQCKKYCMTWEEIKELSNDSLVTIGAHTVNHLPLNKLTENEIMREIEINKLELEKKLGVPIEHFSYPFGGKDVVGTREFKILKKLGFETCTTTRAGNIFLEHINMTENLPRIALTENYELKKKIFLNPLLINKGKRIIKD